MTSTDTDTLWIRRFHPASKPAPHAPEAATLVCFAHAGGSATSFYGLSQALSERLDVVAVQYPGRQDRHREPAIEDLVELADRSTAALTEALGTERPLALFGHSMGACVAFEVARRLERQAGVTPTALFVSGHQAPSLYRADNLHLQGDDALLRDIRALNGTAPHVLDDEDVVGLFLSSLRADYKAIGTYRAARSATVSCPVVALTGDADPKTTVEEARAWQDHTTGSFALRIFSGGHFFVSDQTEGVADVLWQHLTTGTHARQQSDTSPTAHP
ncbi:thioesterase II family protein [Streptomyces lancefieldiae]|uniref:Alpha/beta fold hydrolase n=1 Tax=Streptomyces lancefieldiae TaxID=3075520 RepID=A0ABU3APW5_9ACTN|nr:alpha/beta fold hydrolase [Streptomyces sp. DSM 40712]MDT0612233.1 alpha/beta fold hydrolase [Streptomyces sp. DSM 40712]